MYDTDTQLLYLAVFLAKPELYTTMKSVHKPEFFNPTIKKAAQFIDEYYEDYSSLPDKLLIKTKTTVDVPGLGDVDHAAEQWFMKEYPKFCLHKSLENAIYQSNEELENQNYEAVENIIQKAYEVRLGFDYGINYDEDPKARLQNILDRSGNITSGFETIDRKLGKFNAGDLIIYAGGSGCVVYDTPVELRVGTSSNIYQRPIGSLMGTNENDDIWVSSPDGWVKVLDCVKKFKEIMFTSTFTFGNNTFTIDSSHDHLFQREDLKWVYSSEMVVGEFYIGYDGIYELTEHIEYDNLIDVYDLSVDHENHRYFTNSICSHNTGKSLFLQNHAVNYWKEGKNVLQITLELHPELVARRMDSMLLGLSTKELYSSLDDVSTKVALEKKRSAIKGEMRIKYMPSGTSTSEIKNLVKMYMTDTGKKVDVLIIDYLDLISPVAKVSVGDTFHKDKYVSEELRNIGQEFGPIVITASQLNRSHVSETKEGGDLDHSHIAGGISKINTADLVLGIISNTAMREKGFYELQALKVRNGQGTGLKFPLLYNTNTMRITDDPEYLLTINSNMSVQQSNTQLKDSHVNKMVNDLQNALNSSDPNYTPVDEEGNEVDPNKTIVDSRLQQIQNMINKGK